MRSPFGARPHCRVICVVTPLSSKKISLSGGMAWTVWRNSSRRLRLASVSRSAACSVFFTPLAHLTQHLAHPALRDLNAASSQTLAQLRFGQIRLFTQPAAQVRLDICIHPTDWAISLLHRPLLLTSTRLLNPNLLRISPAHTELGICEEDSGSADAYWSEEAAGATAKWPSQSDECRCPGALARLVA